MVSGVMFLQAPHSSSSEINLIPVPQIRGLHPQYPHSICTPCHLPHGQYPIKGGYKYLGGGGAGGGMCVKFPPGNLSPVVLKVSVVDQQALSPVDLNIPLFLGGRILT